MPIAGMPSGALKKCLRGRFVCRRGNNSILSEIKCRRNEERGQIENGNEQRATSNVIFIDPAQKKIAEGLYSGKAKLRFTGCNCYEATNVVSTVINCHEIGGIYSGSSANELFVNSAKAYVNRNT